jgi:hypothetical protein
MRGFGLWLVAAGLLIAAGVIVPYGLLGGGTPGFAIVIFWCLFGLAVVALIAVGVARWRV